MALDMDYMGDSNLGAQSSIPYPQTLASPMNPVPAVSQQPPHTAVAAPNDGEPTSPALPAADNGSTTTGAGAGPLPTGFGVPAGANGGSTLTEFTKRRNWSQRVLEELKDFLHILTPDGRILYASASAEPLTGYRPEELVGNFIVEFVHTDDSAVFVREFNESIASGNPLRFFYRFRKADGTYTIFESHGHAHLCPDPPPGGTASAGGTPGAAGYCRGFFMMARPYPTKNASLLDSFLEHKIENERLTRRIADLKREEREEDEAQQRQYRESQASFTPSDSRGGDSGSPGSTAAGPGGAGGAPSPTDAAGGMRPPSKAGGGNAALTTQNLNEAAASFSPDSITDKMARYEGAPSHIETIEMLTGLRYRDGERAQGISTGDASPALIRGDAGIPVAADKDGRGGDKKKKLKVADEYVCTDCGTLDSPEWRKGPSGPKTLCNACGCECFYWNFCLGRCSLTFRSAMGKEGEEEDDFGTFAHNNCSSESASIYCHNGPVKL